MAGDKSNCGRENITRLQFTSKRASKPHTLNQIDTQSIRNRGYQIIRDFGVNITEFEYVFDRISKGKLYHAERIGSICHQYSVEVDSENFSQQMRTGGFHTDFMFQATPPEYIALLCLETDPRHPFYGRNQIVPMSALLNRLKTGFDLSIEDILQRHLPYHFANGQHFSVPLLHKANGGFQFKYHQHLVADSLSQGLKKDKTTEAYLAQLHAAMIDVAEDVCLESGDLLIVSNYHALHRRGECSVSFDDKNNVWQSRKMASLRFNI